MLPFICASCAICHLCHLWITLCGSQNQLRHLRPAVVAHRVLAAQSAADVQHRRRLVERAAIVAPAVAARHQHRAEQRQADLSAVDVPGQHQVDAVPPRPGDVVRRVAQAQAERPRRAGRQVRARRHPRPLVTDHHQRLAAHLESASSHCPGRASRRGAVAAAASGVSK